MLAMIAGFACPCYLMSLDAWLGYYPSRSADFKQRFASRRGSLYPALHRMHQEGWGSAEWRATENNRRAHYHRLTPKTVSGRRAELAGMSAEDAHRDARHRFGNPTLLKECTREIDLAVFFETAIQDFRFGVRTLIQNRAVTVVATLTLALGDGANTAISG